MTWKPEIDKLKEVLDFQYGHMLDVGDNALVMQAASLWIAEQIPVQEADSLTVQAEVQGENAERTGGAYPPTGAIPVSDVLPLIEALKSIARQPIFAVGDLTNIPILYIESKASDKAMSVLTDFHRLHPDIKGDK